MKDNRMDFLKANYHAHTWRCQHAYDTEREYIEAAISMGIEIFGFSDHVPCPYQDGYVSNIRMTMKQAPEYVETIRRLEAEYRDQIKIYAGFEAENRDNGHMITSSITAPCICRGIMKYIPKLADAKIVRTWAGYEDLCADGVPVLGPVKEVPGLLLACAFTGHGFGISPIVGKLLSELAMGKETTLDLHELRYDRFQAVI